MCTCEDFTSACNTTKSCVQREDIQRLLQQRSSADSALLCGFRVRPRPFIGCHQVIFLSRRWVRDLQCLDCTLEAKAQKAPLTPQTQRPFIHPYSRYLTKSSLPRRGGVGNFLDFVGELKQDNQELLSKLPRVRYHYFVLLVIIGICLLSGSTLVGCR